MSPKVIDVHTHLYLARSKSGGLEILPWGVPNWSVDSTLAMMDANNIESSLLSQPNRATWHEPGVARAINERFAKIVSAHPERFGAFAVLPLGDIDATLAEIEYCLDQLKFDGVLLSTNVDGLYLGESRFGPIWEELNSREAVVFMHPTTPEQVESLRMGYHHSVLEYMFESTRTIMSLVYSGTKRRHPKVKIISTHGGGTIPYISWRISYFATVYGTAKNNFGGNVERYNLGGVIEDFDVIMGDLKSFYFDLTAAASPYALAAMLEFVPPSQLVMGFDYPMMKVDSFLAAQEGVAKADGLGKADVAAIFSGNARGLFPRLGCRR